MYRNIGRILLSGDGWVDTACFAIYSFPIMYSRNRFQYETATGRGTLPAVFFISLILWLIPSIGDWEQLGSFLCASACAYLLQETDTRFALIRTRTTLPSALFLLGYASFTFLHGWSASCLLPVCFIGILYSLFHSYESPYASTTIFHAFLWLGIAGLIVPTFCWLAPFMYIYMINLRSFSARSFFAGIIGLSSLCGSCSATSCTSEKAAGFCRNWQRW